jgi:hypothetical protein
MRLFILPFVFVLICDSGSIHCFHSQANSAGPRVFVASTPCDSISKSLLHIPSAEKCDFIKWKLTLEQREPNYTLICQYGMARQGTRDFMEGSKTMELKGRWTNDAEAVFSFASYNPRMTLYMLQADQNLFHLLDNNKHLMVGNGGWSYTLNRIDPVSVSNSQLTVSPIMLDPSNNSSIVGIFEGRTPCSHLLRAINKIDASRCQISKWRVTLYQDSVTHGATNFRLKTVYVGTGNEVYVNEGRWQAGLATKQHAGSTIYQLQLDPNYPKLNLNFLKADENILFFLDEHGNLSVGNNYTSYTLNRVIKQRE